jgi:hypothetical protein
VALATSGDVGALLEHPTAVIQPSGGNLAVAINKLDVPNARIDLL